MTEAPPQPAPMTSLLPGAPPFVLDTSSWIQAYNEQYRPSVFLSLWEEIPRLVASRTVIIAEAAQREILAFDDGLNIWMKVSLR